MLSITGILNHMFQWVPVLGGLIVPVMALLTYGTYRREYRRLALGA